MPYVTCGHRRNCLLKQAARVASALRQKRPCVTSQHPGNMQPPASGMAAKKQNNQPPLPARTARLAVGLVGFSGSLATRDFSSCTGIWKKAHKANRQVTPRPLSKWIARSGLENPRRKTKMCRNNFRHGNAHGKAGEQGRLKNGHYTP